MRYMMLIYTDPVVFTQMSEQEQGAHLSAYSGFNREAGERGVMRGGEQLQPITMATTVRVREGKTLVTDGPFAETKEVLGGYYIVDATHLDEAIEWASKLPASWIGSVEIRPIYELTEEVKRGDA